MQITLPEIFVLVGIVFMAAELFVGIETGFDLVILGLALSLGGGVGLLTDSFIITLIVATLLVLAYILFGRKAIKKKVLVLTHSTNIDKLIGKTGLVIRSITPNTPGMIRLDDEDWRATSIQVLYEKDKVKVESIEGVTLRVIKIKKV
jgi:membrane protein implicated in regulation of membrane protease activity